MPFLKPLVLAILLGSLTAARADNAPESPRIPGDEGQVSRTYDDVVRPFLARHCVGCHGPEKSKADLRLDRLLRTSPTRRQERWLTVLERVEAGEMPPEAETASAAKEVRALPLDPGGGRSSSGRGSAAGPGGPPPAQPGRSTRTPCATCWAWTSI